MLYLLDKKGFVCVATEVVMCFASRLEVKFGGPGKLRMHF